MVDINGEGISFFLINMMNAEIIVKKCHLIVYVDILEFQ